MQARSSSRDVVSDEETPSTSKVVRLSSVPVETFDDYVVVGRLGTGGMAEVILALWRGPNGFRKLVAIKRLHEHLREDLDAVEMFMHEARLTAGLHHANVVQVHKVGICDGCPFMAMEYLEGQALNRVLMRMRARGVPGLSTIVVRMMLPVLSGLHYVHEAKDYEGTPLSIVHRDISPQNIFVTFDGQVKLLDFGIAKARSIHAITRSGLIKGKLGYIAPEQASSQQVDRRADVWSVGVTLWEALSGARLFKGRSSIAAAQAQEGQEIPFLSDVNADVPHVLAEIVHKALRYDRNERYQSALEFSQALESWLATEADQAQVALPVVLRSLFFDTIGQREMALRTCLSALDTNDELSRSAERAAASTLRESQESVAPHLSFASPLPATPRHRVARRSAVAIAVAIAAGLGVWQADDGDTARAAHKRAAAIQTVPQPESTLHAAVADAPPSAAPLASAGPARTSDALMAAAAKPSANAVPVRSPSGAAASTTPSAPGSTQASKRPRRVPIAPVLEHSPPLEPARTKNVRSKSSAPMDAPAALPRGRLVLDSVPYSVVSFEGARVGITPVEIDLPASKVTLQLRNPERGISTAYQVQVVAGETISRRISLE